MIVRAVMIVKVQTPIMTTEDEPRILIYNEDRSYKYHGTAPTAVWETLNGQLKSYWEATVVGDDFVLNNQVKEQEW